jgi:hypothetical protein
MKFLGFVIALSTTIASASPAYADPPDFNPYIIAAVKDIAAHRSAGGYNLGHWYSQALDYRVDGEIPQGPSAAVLGAQRTDRQTMCVAAVAEIIIDAIHAYGSPSPSAVGHLDVYKKLSADSWSRGNLLAILPYIFMRGETENVLDRAPKDTPHVNGAVAYTRGTGDALEIWKIGKELSFSQLKQGDFINFNRDHAAGHAAIFWSYIGPDNTYIDTWSPKVIGFQYFSAQGGGNPKKHIPPKPDAGFAFRDAYFGLYSGHGVTPARGVSHPADRTVLRPGADKRILNGGRMWMPTAWNTAAAIQDITGRLAHHKRTRGGDPAVIRGLQEERSQDILNFSGVEG